MHNSDNTVNQWEVLVIGTGSGGKIAAQELAGQGHSVLAVEASRFGGECPYLACVPAKSLQASAHAGLSWDDAVARRNDITDRLDDHAGRDSLEAASVVTARGRATLSGPLADADPGAGIGPQRWRVRVSSGTDGETLHTASIVIVATGSMPVVPPVDGLADVDFWTSDKALSTADQPDSMIVLGGGAIGCELAQAFALLGTTVDLVEINSHLLPGEPRWAGEALAGRLRSDGVRVHLGGQPMRVGSAGAVSTVELADGTTLHADRILVAGGREPRTADLGLSNAGVNVDHETKAVPVDQRCRVQDAGGSAIAGLYAVGDVTGVSNYTHSANYQAKIVVADLSGRGHDADYSAIPRVVYTEPPVFSVGLSADQAEDKGIDVATARFDIDDVERATLLQSTQRPGKSITVRGGVELVIDTERQVIVGATCVGPQAEGWGAELALAIRARVELTVLRDHIRAFPTWSEAITVALNKLTPG